MAADAPEEGTPLEAGLLLLEAEVVAVLVQVFLAVPEVDGKYLVLLLAETDDEVAGVDVVEDESLGVDPLDAVEDLVCDEEDCFEGEGALAVLEELLEGGAEDVGHEGSVVVLDAVPVEVGEAHSPLQQPVKLGLPLEGRLFIEDRVEFDCEFALGGQFEGHVDLRELPHPHPARGEVPLIEGKL